MAGDNAVVVGGGLAGIAAALKLADAGRHVVLLESRPRLGGLAFSFQRGELSVDNGQHVFLRCCTEYRWLLGRLGVENQVTLQRSLDIPVIRGDGKRARLRRTRGVPAPLHLTAALARYAVLSPADRLRAVRGALALKRLNPDNISLDANTLGTYLRQHGQSDATIQALWGIVAIATLNISPDDASLALAAKVFRTGLLDHADAADVGYAAVPLGNLHADAAQQALEAAGVEVAVNHRVTNVSGQAGEIAVRAASRDGVREFTTDTVVLALPHREAAQVVPTLANNLPRIAELSAAPIVNVHIVYDRRVTDLPFAAAVNSPAQWFFDRTESSGLAHPGAQYLAITVSAADGLVDAPVRVLRERFVDEMATLLPAARQASVLDAFVTRERRATFRQAAGSAALRPNSSDSGIEGLYLAGSWTATGWPDTMESAVRSGLAAAEQALRPPTRHEFSRVAA